MHRIPAENIISNFTHGQLIKLQTLNANNQTDAQTRVRRFNLRQFGRTTFSWHLIRSEPILNTPHGSNNIKFPQPWKIFYRLVSWRTTKSQEYVNNYKIQVARYSQENGNELQVLSCLLLTLATSWDHSYLIQHSKSRVRSHIHILSCSHHILLIQDLKRSTQFPKLHHHASE